MHFLKRRVRNGLQSPDAAKYLAREIDSTVELISEQENRIEDLGELFNSLNKIVRVERVPDNYEISLAIMNSGEESGAVLPDTKVKLNGKEYESLLSDDSLFQKFSSNAYFAIAPNTIKVIKITINKMDNSAVIRKKDISSLEVSLRTADEPIFHSVSLK